MAPLPLLRLQQIGIPPQHVVDAGSLAPDRHMFLSPASFCHWLLVPPLPRVVTVVVESLPPQRHILLPPPPLVHLVAPEVEPHRLYVLTMLLLRLAVPSRETNYLRDVEVSRTGRSRDQSFRRLGLKATILVLVSVLVCVSKVDLVQRHCACHFTTLQPSWQAGHAH